MTKRYSYQNRYFSDPEVLKRQIVDKTVIPHQVEVQPGPVAGKICWLECPYCYGVSAEDSGERLEQGRYVEILKQIAQGGVKKIIFAGYATDPLNYKHIEDLVQVTLDNHQVFGFHTKALRVSDRLIEQIATPDAAPLSYFSVSVDAGNNETYNAVHGMGESSAKLYDKVITNLKRVSDRRAELGGHLDISATYLINPLNNDTDQVVQSINDLRDAGVDLVRFTFPQIPRGYTMQEADPNIPQHSDVLEYCERLTPIVEKENGEDCQVIILDLDGIYGTYNQSRTLPCFARFVFPCIGFDGYLSHCSESSAPHFRKLAIADLNKVDFWEAFYDYDVTKFDAYFKRTGSCMNELQCKCDRKEHVVNSTLAKSGTFSQFAQVASNG